MLAGSRSRLSRVAMAGIWAAMLGATAVAVVLLMSSAGVIASEANDTVEPAIGDMNFSGDGYIEAQYDIVQNHPGPPFIWQTGGLNLSVNISAGENNDEYELCGKAYNDENERVDVSDCQLFEIENATDRMVTMRFPDWPDDAVGNHTIILELRPHDDEEEAVSESFVEVFVIQRDGDLTGDGLTNQEEVEYGTDFTVSDTAGNGLTDWEEINVWGTDPLVRDTTEDGVDDAMLVRFGLDPTEPYLAHKYGFVVLLFFLVVGIASALLVRRRVIGGLLLDTRQFRASDSDTELVDHLNSQLASEPVPDQSPEDSLLTNEEYICQLLLHNDRRMKQRQIVESTDWSKAKVSRVLSTLEDEGLIRKIQVGRENIIDLTEEPPARESARTGTVK